MTTTKKPNILFLMCDQMQGRVLNPDHPCQTPNLDKLAASGMRFTRAYTPNAICSPSRASLMTGLLPHNHGVLTCVHVCEDDQSVLRTQHRHWAQNLVEAGYQTAYFGKWHVERSNKLENFGWQYDAGRVSERYQTRAKERGLSTHEFADLTNRRDVKCPAGYEDKVLYGVTEHSVQTREVGFSTDFALEYLTEAAKNDAPWCCLVSIKEPHDPFIVGREAYEKYAVAEIELQPNCTDAMTDKPNIYRKHAAAWADLSEGEKKEAAACYYASITEIDTQYGRLIDKVDELGVRENTIIIFVSDHGELLGSHGLYCKNLSAFEEVYNIPLLISGPGIEAGVTTEARVGLHDLCPTILELTKTAEIPSEDSRSFAEILAKPAQTAAYQTGYAEYYGGPFWLSQYVYWDGDWKYIFNDFDFDELYHLGDDPYECVNRINDPACEVVGRDLLRKLWAVSQKTGDTHLLKASYPGLRLARFGPLI